MIRLVREWRQRLNFINKIILPRLFRAKKITKRRYRYHPNLENYQLDQQVYNQIAYLIRERYSIKSQLEILSRA